MGFDTRNTLLGYMTLDEVRIPCICYEYEGGYRVHVFRAWTPDSLLDGMNTERQNMVGIHAVIPTEDMTVIDYRFGIDIQTHQGWMDQAKSYTVQFKKPRHSIDAIYDLIESLIYNAQTHEEALQRFYAIQEIIALREEFKAYEDDFGKRMQALTDEYEAAQQKMFREHRRVSNNKAKREMELYPEDMKMRANDG